MRSGPGAIDISITFNIITKSTPYIPTPKSGGFTALFRKIILCDYEELLVVKERSIPRNSGGRAQFHV